VDADTQLGPVAHPEQGERTPWTTTARPLAWVGGFIATTALCAWFAVYGMFTAIPGDDEGYMLIALQQFERHGALYTHVYSQYGPFYFQFWSSVFSWLPVSVDNGRIITTIVWTLSALGFGVATAIITRQLAAGLVTQVIVARLLVSLGSESMHPAGLATLLLACITVAAAAIARGHRRFAIPALGVLVVALLCTQVNLGVFAVVALVFTASALGPRGIAARYARVAATALFLVAPLLLVASQSSEAGVVDLATVVALSAAAIAIVTVRRENQGIVGREDVVRCSAAAGVTLIAVIAGALFTGTTFADLVRGMVIDPITLSHDFIHPLAVSWVAVAWAVLGVLAAVAIRAWRSRAPTSAWGWSDTTGAVRVAAGLFILFCTVLQGQFPAPLGRLNLMVACPLLFLVVPTQRESDDNGFLVRVLLVALAVLEVLQVFPVAGAQISWATVLLVPAGMVCLSDGLAPLLVAARSTSAWRKAPLYAAVVVMAVGLLSLANDFVDNFRGARHDYQANQPMTLPGTDLIHAARPVSDLFSSLSGSIRTSCNGFITYPGMNEFYFLSGEAPPTSYNTTDWMFLFPPSQQEQIVRRIKEEGTVRFCVLDAPFWVDSWVESSPTKRLPDGPLVSFIERLERAHDNPRIFGAYRLFVVGRG
jgi:hypothetical protein